MHTLRHWQPWAIDELGRTTAAHVARQGCGAGCGDGKKATTVRSPWPSWMEKTEGHQASLPGGLSIWQVGTVVPSSLLFP